MFTKDSLFTKKEDNLYFDDVNLEKLSMEYGTPLYVFSEQKILANIEHLESTFRKYIPKTEIAYSMKNNSLEDIISVIANRLSSFETTSLKEMKLANNVNKKKKQSHKLISTNLYKSDAYLKELLALSKAAETDVLVAIDSMQDLLNVERQAKKQHVKPNVLIRVNPGIEMDTSIEIFASANITAKCASIIKDIESIKETSNDPTISMWLTERKVEPKVDFAENLISEAAKSNHLNLIGIHGHLGSQISNFEYFERFFEVITKFYKLMNERDDVDLQTLDLGGGYPIDYHKGEYVPSIESIARSLRKHSKIANIQPKIIIESGRYITANSATLVSKVNLTKETTEGTKLAIMDFSVYSDLLDVLTANWYYESFLINNIPDETITDKVSNWELVGGTNDILDRLNPRVIKGTIEKIRTFPRDLQTNDLIAITNVGAYTTCFNNTYSGKSIPGKYIIYKS